jgi:hypothetical protein
MGYEIEFAVNLFAVTVRQAREMRVFRARCKVHAICVPLEFTRVSDSL